MHILVISLCARHSKDLGVEQASAAAETAGAHKSVCINWRLHSLGLIITKFIAFGVVHEDLWCMLVYKPGLQ